VMISIVNLLVGNSQGIEFSFILLFLFLVHTKLVEEHFLRHFNLAFSCLLPSVQFACLINCLEITNGQEANRLS